MIIMNKQNKLITYFKETISLILSIRSRKKRVCYRSALLPNTFLRYHLYLSVVLCIQINLVYAQPPLKKALRTFGDCLSANHSQLEIRDLKDFYRIRGIPAKCCQSLAINLLSNDLVKSVKGINNSNCRVNAFFISDSVFDLHNHPLHFISYVVSGGYAHTIFDKKLQIVENKTKCVPHINQVCAEHSKINTKTDSIKELGTVLLTKSHQESFVKGDFIVFNNTKIIHRPDKILPDTLTINFVSDIGDNEIDVFVSHQTPERKVLLKADTTEPIKKEVSSEVINKSLMIFPISPKKEKKCPFLTSFYQKIRIWRR